jgi:glutathione S-transferase
VYQWSLWSICSLLPPLLDIMYHGGILPEAERDPKLVENGKRVVPPLLRVLEGALAGKEYLVGNQFGIADVNAGSIVNLAPVLGCPLDECPATARWLASLKARPAYQRAVAAA